MSNFILQLTKLKKAHKFTKQELSWIGRMEKYLIHKTITSFEESIFKDNYSFVNEPDELNRHWVMHGRSRRTYTQFDCLKILLWLDAIVFLSEKIEGKEDGNT